MAKELVDVNVDVVESEPIFAIGTDKIIGFHEEEVCGTCGAPLKEDYKYCTECGIQVRKRMETKRWTIVEEDEIDEEEVYGTITIESEETEPAFDSLQEVFFALLEMGLDLTKTKLFKESKISWFNSDVTNPDIFLEVFFEELTEEEEILFKEKRDIVIQECVENCSFSYDYGSISSTHTEYAVIGYNVYIEDIE